MKTVSPFREIDPQSDRVLVRFEGAGSEPCRLAKTSQAALLVAGVMPFRHTRLSLAPPEVRFV